MDMGYAPYASVSIRPISRRYRIWEYWILPHVSIYLSPFPARNIDTGILDVASRQYLSIPLSSPKFWIWDMPRVSIYLSPFPAQNIGYMGYAPYARNIDLLASVSIHLLLQPQI